MAKQNKYEKKRTKALHLGYIFVAVVLVTFMVFIGRIVALQNDSNVKDIEKNRNLFLKMGKSYQSSMISLFSL